MTEDEALGALAVEIADWLDAEVNAEQIAAGIAGFLSRDNPEVARALGIGERVSLIERIESTPEGRGKMAKARSDLERAASHERAADYLATCSECGRIHQPIPRNPDNPREGVTWHDPVDGHVYRRNGSKTAEETLRKAAT